MRLYLDTAPVIYTVEDVPIYAQAVDNCLAVFFTNDHRLDRFKGIRVKIIQPS
jgi:hypothetical protein